MLPWEEGWRGPLAPKRQEDVATCRAQSTLGKLAWLQLSTLSLASSLTLSKPHKPSEPLLPHLQMGIAAPTCLLGHLISPTLVSRGKTSPRKKRDSKSGPFTS